MTQTTLQLDEQKLQWVEHALATWRFIVNDLPREFSCDALHNRIVPPPHPNHWGSLIARLKKEGLIRKVGYKVSERKSANGRPISLWQTAEDNAESSGASDASAATVGSHPNRTTN